MKGILFTVFITGISLSLPVTLFSQKPKQRVCGPTVNEKLIQYFGTSETKPDQIINNTHYLDNSPSKPEVIKIGGHIVEWITDPAKVRSEVAVKIDGELIALANLESKNAADGDQKFNFDLIGEWRQIKLYRLYTHDIVGLTLGPEMCTGLMCGVATQLFFDVKLKKVTAFATFRADEEVRLHRLTNEENYYYVSKTFDGDPHGIEKASITYQAYRLLPSGDFQLATSSLGKPYFLKHTYYPDVFDLKIKKYRPAGKPDELEQKWIQRID